MSTFNANNNDKTEPIDVAYIFSILFRSIVSSDNLLIAPNCDKPLGPSAGKN